MEIPAFCYISQSVLTVCDIYIFCVQQIVNPYKGRGVTYIDMKRTIYTFIACLSAFAMPATAASYDLVTSNADKTGQASMSSNTANAYTRGFVFSLGSDWFFPTMQGGGGNQASLPANVLLNSLSITLRNTTLYNLIVLSGNAAVAGQSSVVGFTSVTSTDGGIGTWSFAGGLLLDTTTTYTFLFTSLTDASGWTSSSTVGNTAQQQGIKTATMGTNVPSGYPAGEGLYNNYGNLINTSASVIRMDVSSQVPEPSTAVLGLFGLSSLMLRRRR